MNTLRLTAFCLLAYIVAVAAGIEAMNNSILPGGYLQAWHQEQQESYGDGGGGSGQGKMRGQDDFLMVLQFLGTWVYPASLAGAALFTQQIFSSETALGRILCGVFACLCLAILARFLSLGVFSAASGLV